ncbi:hypothetical protein N7478_003013 [Penicillium angulare]|uniref:uncharacterized protein n=1 Tax=Penicillium angulare TaxID=116970 RepID=UPI0025410160|nr:uncharacterized protein N7478_003013 [Penicillium angulare]KAJ5287327.1 hypothetical protein N7478_003013 [Penicillium angulare]
MPRADKTMTRDYSARPTALSNFTPPTSCHNFPTSPLLRIMADQTDRVLCHACGGVSLKDDRGGMLSCSHCESDFVEIIEIPPDNDPHELPSDAGSPTISSWRDQDPWRHEETEPSGFWPNSSPPGFGHTRPLGSQQYSHHTYRSSDGRFAFTSTSTRGGFSPRQGAAATNPTVPMMLNSLDEIFRALSETGLDNRGARGAAMDPFHAHTPGWQEHDHPGSESFPDPDEVPPRDPDAPRFGTAPVDSLAEYAYSPDSTVTRRRTLIRGFTNFDIANDDSSLFGAFQPEYGRRRGVPGARGAPPNPLGMISAILNLNRSGDAVYSQEELDRVVSQLIDHNAPGAAPPPATTTAIRSLPQKKVDRQMLGSDGTAECSICMEAVEIDTEVTVLPCTHWFHFSCIEAWLNQHNTCPHCRRSIDSTHCATGENTNQNPFIAQHNPTTSNSPPSGRQRRRSSPFSSLGRRSSSRSNAGSPPRLSFIPDGNTIRRSRVSSHSSQNSRNEGQRGGFTNWVWSRFGGGNN